MQAPAITSLQKPISSFNVPEAGPRGRGSLPRARGAPNEGPGCCWPHLAGLRAIALPSGARCWVRAALTMNRGDARRGPPHRGRSQRMHASARRRRGCLHGAKPERWMRLDSDTPTRRRLAVCVVLQAKFEGSVQSGTLSRETNERILAPCAATCHRPGSRVLTRSVGLSSSDQAGVTLAVLHAGPNPWGSTKGTLQRPGAIKGVDTSSPDPPAPGAL